MKDSKNIAKNESSKLKERIKHLEIENRKIYLESEKYKKQALKLKIIEKKYLEIDERLNRIIEESNIGMALADLKGKFIRLNPALCRILGYSEDELLSKSIRDIIHPDDIPIQLSYYNQLLEGKILSYHIQKRYLHKDGHIIWTSVTTSLEHDIYGKPLHIIGQIQDITQKIEAEEKLMESEERFRLVFEKGQFGITIADSKFKFINTNPAFRQMTGYTAEELSKLTFADITSPSSLLEDTENVRLMSKGKLNQYQTEKQYLKKDGSLFWGNLVLTPVFNNKGKLIVYVALIQDITERKRLEKELFKWAQVIEHADWGIAIGSADGKTLEAMNPAYAKMHGYTTEELIGKPISIVYQPKYVAILFNNISIAHKKGNHSFETFHIRKDGTIFPALVSITAVKNKKGAVLLRAVNIKDISEQKRLEEELLRAKEKAEEADKLKTAFLCNMSHEIRTPMNAIMGFADLIENNELTAEKRKVYAKTISHRANDLLTIINDIIDISKIESGTLSINEMPGFLNVILEEIKLFFKSRNENLIKKPIEFKVHNQLNSEQNKILYDFLRLKQVLINLVENALKFTSEGFIEIGCKMADNKNILIYVKDTGMGIPKDKQSLIFDRFRQADETFYGKKHGGAGLGLSISKGIIELMKGKIWVESEEDKGSVFYFKIPYKHSNEVIEPLKPENNPTYNWKNKTILLVEDIDYNADVIGEMLSETNVKVIVAKNGISALEIFQQNPDINLVLMDIRLPDITGLEVTREIKKQRKDIVIVAQTAYASEEDKRKCLEAGCHDYISKPIVYNKMFKTLSKYLD